MKKTKLANEINRSAEILNYTDGIYKTDAANEIFYRLKIVGYRIMSYEGRMFPDLEDTEILLNELVEIFCGLERIYKEQGILGRKYAFARELSHLATKVRDVKNFDDFLLLFHLFNNYIETNKFLENTNLNVLFF